MTVVTTAATSPAAAELPIAPAVRVTGVQMVAEATYQVIARAFDARGIDHLVLKGPHLGALVYDEAWQRDYGDLDVLVRREQFAAALVALVDSGFSLQAGRPGREATIGSYYNRSLLSPQGWLVELHRAFSAYDLYRVDYDALFSRAVPFRFGRVGALGLGREDLLLHLIIHAAKSHFRYIETKHVRDAALLVMRCPVAWELFVARAAEAGCRTASWVLLSAAVTIHGAPVPDQVLHRLRPSLPWRWWLGLWLTGEQFPLFRRQGLPLWWGRLVVAPAIVDNFWHGLASGLRFASVRLRDVAGGVTRR
jgi:hypothetical protein